MTDRPIAKRDFQFGTEAPGQSVKLEICQARRDAVGDWTALIRITGLPSGPIEQTAHGVDSVQATQLALVLAGTYLYTSGKAPGAHVFRQVPNDDLGLPVTEPLRELVERRDPANSQS